MQGGEIETTEWFAMGQGHTWCFSGPTGTEIPLTDDEHLAIFACENTDEAVRRHWGADVAETPVICRVQRDGTVTEISLTEALTLRPDAAEQIIRAACDVLERCDQTLPLDFPASQKVTSVLGARPAVSETIRFREEVVPLARAFVQEKFGLTRAEGHGMTLKQCSTALRTAITLEQHLRMAHRSPHVSPALFQAAARTAEPALGFRSIVDLLVGGSGESLAWKSSDSYFDNIWSYLGERSLLRSNGKASLMVHPSMELLSVVEITALTGGRPTIPMRVLSSGLKKNPQLVAARLGCTSERMREIRASLRAFDRKLDRWMRTATPPDLA